MAAVPCLPAVAAPFCVHGADLIGHNYRSSWQQCRLHWYARCSLRVRWDDCCTCAAEFITRGRFIVARCHCFVRESRPQWSTPSHAPLDAAQNFPARQVLHARSRPTSASSRLAQDCSTCEVESAVADLPRLARASACSRTAASRS